MAEHYQFGIEEEYFIVDAKTKAVQRQAHTRFLLDLKRALGPSVTRELLQSQLEVSTKPSFSMADTRVELKNLRQTIGAIAAEHGLSYFASGTHPTAAWGGGQHTKKDRYDGLMHDLQMLGERNLLCGLHVHVELPNPDSRVDVMRRMLPYVPLFIALSTSSPFWRSKRTGLMGYRLAAYDELPRTGLPELFQSKEEYEAYVQALVDARVMKDSSYVWWAIRPSYFHPTLELRAPDSCTRLEDAVAIAALYRSLASHLVRKPYVNSELTAVDRAIAVENKWRAQRFGIHGSFVDRRAGRAVTVAEALDELIALVEPDARMLGCEQEIANARAILSAGTSADIQIAVYRETEEKTGSRNAALQAVKTWLAEATLH
jgi:carboxylate-amine ligase